VFELQPFQKDTKIPHKYMALLKKLFEQLFSVMPDSEEIFVSSEQSGAGVGPDFGVHTGLLHPRCRRLCAKAYRRSVLLCGFFSIFFIFDFNYNNVAQ